MFIYFLTELPCSRDEIEDELETVFEGIGEVTGGGSGNSGSNVDLELSDSMPQDEALRRARDVLHRMGVMAGKIVLAGLEYPI